MKKKSNNDSLTNQMMARFHETEPRAEKDSNMVELLNEVKSQDTNSRRHGAITVYYSLLV